MRKHSWLKKSIASLLALTMLLGAAPFTVFASDAKTLEEINRENAAAYAVSFVDVVFENPGLESGDVIPFYDETDNLSGYCVDIMDDGQPNGYVIIKFPNGEQTVSEFVVEPGVKNPYDQMAEEENLTQENVTYYSVGFADYQIVDTGSNAVYSFENEESTVGQFQELKQEVKAEQRALYTAIGYQPYSTNSVDPDQVISDSYVGTVYSQNTLPGATSVAYCGTTTVNNVIKRKYACSVVALCNMMKYYYSRGYTNIDANLATMYDAIWNYAGTDSSGGTQNDNVPVAAQKYLNSRGYSCSYDMYWLNLYSDFTRDINNGKPCTLSYQTNEKGGHTVLVIGYVETISNEYLRVMDGWNMFSRYLNYDGYNYNYKIGISYQIS